MRRFLAAIAMLSICPVGRFLPTERDLRGMVDCYPWVGVLFAVVGWGAGWGAGHLPIPVGALFLTLLPEVLTKGLHLDGLADTADGFLSGRSRERKLEIMRDSRIGTMGVAAIFAVLGMKFALFASLPKAAWPMAAALSLLEGRCAIVWYIAFSRYARPEGLGKLNFERKPWWGLAFGALLPGIAGFLIAGPTGLWLSPATILAMWLWSRMTARVIGGATGDTIGCAEELTELLLLGLYLAVRP